MTSKTLKILMLMKFPLFGGGSGNYIRKLSEKLARLDGVEVAVAAPDSRKFDGVKLYTIHPRRKAVFVSHPEYKRAKSYRDLTGKEFTDVYQSFMNRIIEVVEDYNPDVIHVHHCSFLTWIANYIKSIYGIPYVVTAHGTGIFQATADHRFLSLTRQALERSEYIFSNSNYTNKWLLKIFGSKLKRKTRIVPCGIDLQAWHRNQKIRIIENKYNLQNKKVVIFVGRLTWEKGVKYLIDAAINIKAEIFIIGGGTEKEKLAKLAKKRKADNVHFLGYFGKEYIEELHEFYQRADCVVLPSVCDEGLGIVILEAMASETPVVATNKGGIPLAVKDEKTGYLVRAKSGKVISDAVNRLLNNPKDAEIMGKNARELVENKFDWVKIRDGVMKYYYQAAETGKKLKIKKYPPGFTDRDVVKESEELKRKIDYIP
jgi:glycosyltransferase involved in cell wall biosynthesis